MPPHAQRLVRWLPTGIGLLLAGISAAILCWQYWPRYSDDHRSARRLILYYTLKRVQDPIVVLGDSNTEAAILPAAVCGHPLVNAGLNGATTASDMGNWLIPALDGKRPAMIIVALGTNDALTSTASSEAIFTERYSALLSQLGTLTSHLAVLAIPPIEQRDRVSAELSDRANHNIAAYNAALPQIAKSNGASFAPLPPMPEPHTLDGVHLNAGGHQQWISAVAAAASKLCGG